MKSHNRSHSGGSESESGWASTISAETWDRTTYANNNNDDDADGNIDSEVSTSPINHDLLIDNQDLLVTIPLSGDSSATGASFLPEDFSMGSSHHAAAMSSIDHHIDSLTDTSTLAPESVASIVDEVLLSLQRARRELQERASRPIPEEDTVVNATADGLHELKHSLKTYHRKGLSCKNEALLRRVEDFHKARFLRRQQSQNSAKPWGIFGLFQFLSDLEIDLEWAEDAAWRRKHRKVYLAWSDFEAIHKKTRQLPYFVYAMMVISSILLVVAFHMNDWEFAPVSVNPMLGPSPQVLFRLGALDRRAVIEDDEWYRLVVPVFLHAGLVHFALNMAALFFIGGALERRHGTAETILVFLLAAVGGNIASTLFMSPSISVGASGGIFGMLGVCLADIVINLDLLTLKNRRDVLDPAHNGFPYGSVLFWLFIEVTLNILLGFTPFVDQFAHMAGLLFGIGFGIPFLRWLKGDGFFGVVSPIRRCIFGFARFCLFSVTMAALFVMAYLLLESDGEPLCEECRYMSCLPFPFWTQDTWWNCDDCDLTMGKIAQYLPTTIVELTCPSSEIIQIDLLEPNVDRTLIQQSLSSYCRQHCSIS